MALVTQTVTQIVTGALQLLGVKVNETAIEASEAEDGRVALNDMMNEWSVDGINIGYESLDSVEDELFVTLGAVGAIKANLAVYIAPEYQRTVSEVLFNRARTSKRSVRASIKLNGSSFPDTLPIGSGNEDNNYVADGDSAGNLRSSKFYPTNNTNSCN